MIDFLIVGNGLAGIAFAEIALQNNKTVLVFDNNSQPSSKIAGGLYNPVILKRFSEVWKAKEQLDFASIFYQQIQNKCKVVFDYQIPILRKLHSIEEQNNWFHAADKPNLAPFLDTNLLPSTYKHIEAPFYFGKVNHTGYLDVASLIAVYSNYLRSIQSFQETTFEYTEIQFLEHSLSYKNIAVKNIVFAEGFGLHQNPFFNNLPLDGTKGELLLIYAPDLKLDTIINASIFILPLGNNLYKVGATYDWIDKTNSPTNLGKQELVEKLKEVISCDFEIKEHFAGVRPTVNDRRPLVGTHPEHSRLHILNGLGTRGVMLAPYLANQLYENITNHLPLDKEIDCSRYYKKNRK